MYLAQHTGDISVTSQQCFGCRFVEQNATNDRCTKFKCEKFPLHKYISLYTNILRSFPPLPTPYKQLSCLKEHRMCKYYINDLMKTTN